MELKDKLAELEESQNELMLALRDLDEAISSANRALEVMILTSEGINSTLKEIINEATN